MGDPITVFLMVANFGCFLSGTIRNGSQAVAFFNLMVSALLAAQLV